MLQPFNRYVQVEPLEEKEEEKDLAIVLPDNYSKPISPYLKCEALSISAESKFCSELKIGDEIIIERRMMLSIELGGETTYLVLENYIYGRINNEID